MKIEVYGREAELKYDVPFPPLKNDFREGTYGENHWARMETACVSRRFYILPNESEWAVYKYVTRTNTGKRTVRFEVWRNGRWWNNYFEEYYPAVIEGIKNELTFNGYDDKVALYAV